MKNKSILVILLITIIITFTTNCTKKKTFYGVTDTEVVIGWTTPLSGPAALWGVTGMGGKGLG